MHTLKIGADIEAFLQNKKTGEIVSAEGIVQGSKKHPFVFDSSDKFFATSLDNVLAEHCIPPSVTREDFVTNILKAQHYLNSLDNDLCVASIPCAILDERYLQTENAKTFGCEPDFNAWDFGSINSRPECGVSNLRTAGFHVHFGYDGVSGETNLRIMRNFDMFVTLPAMLIEPPNDRRLLYGKAGAMRHKPYGMEARTLSAYFASSPELIQWVYDSSVVAAQSAFGEDLASLHPEIERIINSNDVNQARLFTIINNINTTIGA